MRGKRGEEGRGSWAWRSGRAALLLSSLIVSIGSAQSAKKSAACTVNPSDAWVKRQAEWLDDSKHDWKNDSLRTALLAAAGLTAPLKAPAQVGVHVEGREPALGPTAGEMTNQLKSLAATRGRHGRERVWSARRACTRCSCSRSATRVSRASRCIG